jgi:uncharacterized repeat protein (TIGR01451 family)
MRISMRLTLAAVLFALVAAMAAGSAPAFAGETSWWQLADSTRPAVLKPDSEAVVVVRAANLGDVGVTGQSTPVQISDTLPANLTAVKATATAGTVVEESGGSRRGEVECPTVGATVTCKWEGFSALQPFEEISVYITVKVGEVVEGAESAMSVSGGNSYLCVHRSGGSYDGPFCGFEEEGHGDYEAELSAAPVPAVSLRRPVDVGTGETTFGLSNLALEPESEGGAPDTQAGSHPFQFTTTVAFNEGETKTTPPGFPKDLAVNLPPGLIGNVQSIPECTEAQFADATSSLDDANGCPDDSAVGAAVVNVYSSTVGSGGAEPATQAVPVFNLVPSPGEPARFGFEAVKSPVILDTGVRTGTDYGVTTRISNLTEFTSPASATVSLWGTPGAATHSLVRGWSCIRGGEFYEESEGRIARCSATAEPYPRPFLTLPTSCGPLSASAEVDSWQEPNKPPLVYEPQQFGNPMEALEGCGTVPFAPEFSLEPEAKSTSTSSPTGLPIKIHQNQAANENPNGLATPDIRSTTVTLPEGFALNAAAANGLEACPENQIGFKAALSSGEQKTFSSTLPSPFCPEASKIGKVKIKTPLLAHELEGAVYLAAQTENPFGSLVAMYMVAEDPVSGVLVKLPGEVSLNPTTGQVTTTFANTPQLPFEELELNLFGGNGAPLTTPTHCGAYTTTASFTPWSGGAPVSSSSSLQITSGPGGTPCPGTLPFSPSFTAGTTATQAGAYSPFTLAFARNDGEQDLNSIEQTLPPGLLAKLAGVPLCGEAQANEGSCPQTSQIGTVTVAAGVGKEPLYVNGTIYLTGPYNNGPFGISVEVPAIAGPFNLDEGGRPVVVRGSIRINPTTAQATVVSNAGAGGIPIILQGIPLQVRSVNVTLNRAGFTFNPTSCTTQKLTASIGSTEGATAGVSSPFGAVNCATLPFKPTFTATTVGQASKAYGASLVVKITSKGGPGTSGEEANIHSVKVDLPKQLPSRLTTLQKACTEAQFNSNPAGCPKESNVGTATAKTPVLASPLTGPAYLVSHGGEAFPDLEIVLQSEGVKLVLDGNTQIKKGITSSTFKTVPDAPISSFELKLPVGKYSILGTNLPQGTHYSLCGQTLNMPTAITGQNGAEIHDTTKIAISGCSKKKASKRKPKKKKKKKQQKKG